MSLWAEHAACNACVFNDPLVTCVCCVVLACSAPDPRGGLVIVNRSDGQVSYIPYAVFSNLDDLKNCLYVSWSTARVPASMYLTCVLG